VQPNFVDRLESLQQFVDRCFPGRHPAIEPASSDASFRRYFRLQFDDGTGSRIIMDAPPDKEDCGPFIHVAGLLGEAGLNVPRVLAQDLANGFLLLPDLGAQTYLNALQTDPGCADALYGDAISSLVDMQRHGDATSLPAYDRALLLREMELLPDWYIARHRAFTLNDRQAADLQKAFETLIANNLAQPAAFVHRDFHSRNLMVSSPGAGNGRNPGILDFQDAVRGPITYDLVSLLKDAYIEWEEEQVLEWAIRYWKAAGAAGLPVDADFGAFYRDFEWMGLQRHLKVLGIFARLYHRDGKDQYLADLPLVMRHTRKTCERYVAFTPLLRLFDAIERIERPGGFTF
jgi:aminoglycoside/choline kinase family phosphotransferase